LVDHNKSLIRAKENLRNSDILDVNKENIFNFLKMANSGATHNGEPICKRRQFKYANQLRKMAGMLDVDFKKATKDDIIKLVDKINNMKRSDGKDCTDWTKYTYKIVLKTFYKHLFDGENYPECVKWIKPKIPENHTEPSDVLSFEDVKKLANATDNIRDRAFILFLYESGARIGEVSSIRVKDFVTPDKYGSMVHIPKGKTGPRDIRIIHSAPAISNWLSQHPTRDDKNSLIFCGISNNKKGKAIEYNNYRRLLLKAAEKAGISKPVNPHNFRHSRATELSKIFSESILCKYMGWVIGSQEAATYVHLDSDAVKNAYDEAHGIKKTENKETLTPIICPRCNTKNDFAAKFCSGCSLGLDEKSILEYDQRREQIDLSLEHILQDPMLTRKMLKQLIPMLQEFQEENRKT
jgi:integrase/recombinase XerD